jgi:hypothetical protein
LLLSLKSAPEAKLVAGHDSSGTGGSLDAAALKARREVLEGADEVAAAFLKLGDIEGIHNAAVLAWNAGALAALTCAGMGRRCAGSLAGVSLSPGKYSLSC